MSSLERMTLAAGLAVALAATALSRLFLGPGWAGEVFGAVAVVTLSAVLARRLSFPRPLQPVWTLLALAGYLVIVFAGGTLAYGFLPGARTVESLQALLSSANADILRYRAPVPTSAGLVLVSAAGVGVVAVLVDLLAVTLARAGLAGLPLLALFAVPAAVVPDGIGWLPFVAGAVGWLLMLMVEGHGEVGRWGTTSGPGVLGESSLGRLGRRIGFSALGVAVVLPLLVPGLDKTLIGGTSPDGDDRGAATSAHTYNPITRLRSQLTLPKPVLLLQYRTEDPSPDYLRLTTLDRFDGGGWSASPLSQKRDDSRVQKGIATPVGETGPHQRFRMKVAVAGSNLDVFWLPLPFGPTKVGVEGIWLWDPASQTAFSAARTTKNLPPYDVEASRSLPQREALAQAVGVDAGIAARYGTPVRVTPYVSAVTANAIAGATTPYAKAVALQQFFSPGNGFAYDLSPPLGRQGEDPLEVFLRGRRGFCEQYATAMAAMLRIAGIPSRVAVGFTRGEPLPGRRGTYSVSTQQAHAWPEAWFAGSGWVRFEPTPGQSTAIVPRYTLPLKPAPVPSAKPGAATPTPKASPAPSKPRLEPEDLLAKQEGNGGSGLLGALVRWSLAALGVLAVLSLPAALTLLRRRRRWRSPGPLTAWAQLREDAHDIGYRWHEGDSPRAAASRLLAHHRLPVPAREALGRLALSAELARYARPSGPLPAQQQAQLQHDSALVRSALRHTRSRSVRLRSELWAPSTVRWVSEGAGDLLEVTTERLEDAAARLVRRVRRKTA